MHRFCQLGGPECILPTSGDPKPKQSFAYSHGSAFDRFFAENWPAFDNILFNIGFYQQR
jgi:hypothetical protein